MFIGKYYFDDVPLHNAKVLTGFGGQRFCLMTISEKGTIEYISCAVNSGNLENEDIVEEIYEKKTIRLSRKDKKIINDLIEKTISRGPIKDPWAICDAVEIRALINGKKYASIYMDVIYGWYYHKELANLTYHLVKIAPITVGWEQNPLKVPIE